VPNCREKKLRKRITGSSPNEKGSPGDWLNLENLADVEVSSESPSHPIEAALIAENREGWRAGEPGAQTVRLLFTRPQSLKRISLEFTERVVARTQEYAIRWTSWDQSAHGEVVRQRWNFDPRGATSEREDHRVELEAVGVLELSIIPDVSGGSAVATLARLRLA
jgi:hypothetical protein